MEHWAEIRRLHRSEGMPIKAIARRLGVARNDCPDRHCDHNWSCCSTDNPNDCTPTAPQTTTT